MIVRQRAVTALRRAVERPLLTATRGIRVNRTNRNGPRATRRPPTPVSATSKTRAIDAANTRPIDDSKAVVVIPQDAESVLGTSGSEAAQRLVSHGALVVCRQIEMLNVFVGFEQANKYVVYDSGGACVGYIAEDSGSMATGVVRQLAGTHRPFQCTVLDPAGNPVMKVRRPFALVNSRITISAIDHAGTEVVIGEVRQRWHALRRKYDLLLARPESRMAQFGVIDEPTLSWDFSALDEEGRLLGSINRNMRGLVRELFTDTGHYVVRMDAASAKTTNLSTSGALVAQPQTQEAAEARDAIANTGHRSLLTTAAASNAGGALANIEKRPMNLDERAVLLATAISVDFDYFSKMSHAGGGGLGMMPFFLPIPGFGGGGASTPEAVPGQEAGMESSGESTPGALTPQELQQEGIDPGGASDTPWWQDDGAAQQGEYAQSEHAQNDAQQGSWWDNAMQDDGDAYRDTDNDPWSNSGGGGDDGDWGGDSW